MSTNVIIGGAVIGLTDFILDKSLRRALIVGAATAFVIYYIENNP